MKHDELVSLAARFCRGYCKCGVVATEIVTFASFEVPDVIGWTFSGYSTVIECKVSRSDFRADAKKPYRRENGLLSMGNTVWYAVPRGLLSVDDVAPGFGLVELGGARARVLRKPISRGVNDINVVGERAVMASIVRRITEHDGLAPLASWCLPAIDEGDVEEVAS